MHTPSEFPEYALLAGAKIFNFQQRGVPSMILPKQIIVDAPVVVPVPNMDHMKLFLLLFY